MDFEMHYSKELTEFRQEVRQWLEANAKIPSSLGEVPLESEDITREQWKWTREFHRKLGHKGWLYPVMPAELGGGGLTVNHAIIIEEELARYEGKIPPCPSAGAVALAALINYGTEEQKQRFVKPMLLGETVAWQLWTEADAGVDLAAIKAQAVPTANGDGFIVNGSKAYISGIFEPDYMNALLVTDPHAPRHGNLGQFYFPANLPGISWERQDLMVRGGQHFIYFDNVYVSREYLIGGERQGWRVTQSSLELEHGAEGVFVLPERMTVALDLAKKWPEIEPCFLGDWSQERLVDAYIYVNVYRLLARRNFWMFNTKQTQSYQGSQFHWFGRETRIRTAEDVLDCLGLHALTTDPKWRLLNGRVELAQRGGSFATHGAGSYEIDKVIISRRVGLSRTREVAAPTQLG